MKTRCQQIRGPHLISVLYPGNNIFLSSQVMLRETGKLLLQGPTSIKERTWPLGFKAQMLKHLT